jgi:hypothetical protein
MFERGVLQAATYLSMTSPTTSSMTAALTRTEPTLVSARLTELEAELITAKVVPDTDEHRRDKSMGKTYPMR